MIYIKIAFFAKLESKKLIKEKLIENYQNQVQIVRKRKEQRLLMNIII